MAGEGGVLLVGDCGDINCGDAYCGGLAGPQGGGADLGGILLVGCEVGQDGDCGEVNCGDVNCGDINCGDACCGGLAGPQGGGGDLPVGDCGDVSTAEMPIAWVLRGRRVEGRVNAEFSLDEWVRMDEP